MKKLHVQIPATLFLLLNIFSSVCGIADDSLPEVKTVNFVELPRYMGKWYEIASYPQRFQKGCTATTAEYTLKENGKVAVVNSCRLDTPQGKLKVAEGEAYVADTTTNAKLRVTFFWPFYGDYWIIELGKDYEYAVVAGPDRDYLWILAREPKMGEVLYQDILNRIAAQNFDLTKLVKTVHE